MARIRSVKPEFFMDEELAALPAEARLLFIGLWTLADKDGRLEDRPKRIKAGLFPYDSTDVEPLLAALATGDFIQRYKTDGHACISIRNFAKHQRPHPKETSYGLPPPPEPGTSTASPEVSRQGVDASRRVPVVVGSGNGDGDGDGNGSAPNPHSGGEEPDESSPPLAAPAPQPGQPWTLQDAVDAVHRVVKKRPHRWDVRVDEPASRTLTGYCLAEGLEPVEEIARRFGRALERSGWPFERAPGKAVTLRELARRECWEINADPPERLEERRNTLTAVNEKVPVRYDPWEAVCQEQEATHEH
jgi:hypothetical protein